MQQYSSLPEQNSSVDETSTLLTTIQQLSAELWLERSLNQLQSRLNDCLLVGYGSVLQCRTTAAEIFQTAVNELSIAFNGMTVAIALFQPKAEIAQICYISYSSSPSPQFIFLKQEDKKLQWQLQAIIAVEDLERLESEEPNHVRCLTDDAGAVIGWLIISKTLPKYDQKSLTPYQSQLRSQLLERAIKQCVTALAQMQKIQSLQQQSQQLGSCNEKLERTNQLKNQFLANTSHEIRTPLSSIIGFSQLLLAQGYKPTKENHQEYLRIIQSSGKHLLTLINDILDLSKIEANQLEVEWENINVREMCRNVLALVKEKAANKGLKLDLKLHPDVTTMVADPLRLKQMLLNLLFNALKFTKTGTVGLEVLPKDGFVHFIVWDTGVGISPENQEQLFQPYFQVANSVVHRSEGSGLGLTVTRKLVEIHGGWLEVESEVDHGSRFTIILPVKPVGELEKYELDLEKIVASDQDKHQQEEGESTLIVPSSSLNILLVENDLPNGELIRIYLGTLGYQVTWVKSAGEMWSALTQLNPIVILMDILLPDGNGLKLVQQLRERPNYQMIPVIVQTAMAMKGDRETCLAAGVDEYISKPIDLPVLGNLVAKYCKVSSRVTKTGH
ncbi:hybrid histidine kinase/response regulator HrmK [Umezakia ovalisporum]|jgi:signal transduction histidine kinase/ActR/RegA family two-component response regulator|uniref:Circadian input-output histidine kinase CikA n=1 Tax=Umezakia ovalisporum FSS-62 TaxID=2971776 RepID=A0AA43GX12_9CYAN|nr:hybrid histidine kinase/response regulator HrmK [Umezakia ovalisporum]MBI1241218.1 response regulator [Nostoc sp. RI_552]MDH6063334.1 hybrid histidine kinase/response regulator HrmK [Umezakia ovalisporum FSS-62]MDH6083302.1 hybrid histidine kinase/response regulator HrmK [Umezakia ovalisporum TAC611]MDH6088064.1 hybrid histidine kinase/response regulator HrmK [Umezakia ovalisporum Ak1311]MDH6103878.1 hybrid histidine kinase/response regulator HrmK [Umezakia ovalisporum ANA283AFssAo]